MGEWEKKLREPRLSPWNRFVRWSYDKLGDYLYPPKADICNCGVDLQIQLPRADLVLREDMETGSLEWRMQMYGAALYYHAATRPFDKMRKPDLDFIRGKDVLEVACMRGGGARYLSHVFEPKSFVGVDNVQGHIDTCLSQPNPDNLRFQLGDAMDLAAHFEPASFDVVMCIQAVSSFTDIPHFVRESAKLLRPGGRLVICEALVRDKFKAILDTAEEEQLSVDLAADMSRAVHSVGLCKVPTGISYLHIVARKPEEQP